ncbi:hypothetical protein [Flavobacterium kingsejongi]|uniref:Uncharacterized protein n=1 Tax=Flavobacterium kingsejongi TaxID=1678728 RepID=A0A2S1LM63_9FLAO|nr:hypothetical protein [Flavobacterium kingsejongi]AWG24814.1 hypothetical protein FK004_06015 [Flavobacterium kingsejongi]AWG25040.1 hypothetical protein FK004_07240 [Flavobacterium kingsejongi]
MAIPLEFVSHIKDKPTYFAEKIIKGICDRKPMYFLIEAEQRRPLNFDKKVYFTCGEKIHTIRKDEQNVWEIREVIIPVLRLVSENPDQNPTIQFAPAFHCMGIQKVVMVITDNNIQITIDGRPIHEIFERLKFALNDGFDYWSDFAAYWKPIIKKSPQGVYQGKIIHFTGFLY